MYKIELTALQLIKIINLLDDDVGEYELMTESARKDGEGDVALAYFFQARAQKKLIASIEAQMKEQSK